MNSAAALDGELSCYAQIWRFLTPRSGKESEPVVITRDDPARRLSVSCSLVLVRVPSVIGFTSEP